MSRCSCDYCTTRNPDAGGLLIRAIHAAEEANRGRPGYAAGVKIKNGNRKLNRWNRPDDFTPPRKKIVTRTHPGRNRSLRRAS